ncbi:YeeE/YedE family protein [Alicyclobacillus sp. SO9]|uniref:YeeE/YedE family protein n=1 Tax=Alicyclobacillus sp. SO9 TaxID=2665646 RepID=UPI0018E84F8D|nr:YeeE/YedE family protein [Alicyclobacillus sp. SO9]QQE78681.1 YeeE/YedE family protein [Alicyclobacillus sp. SO9]
MATTESQILNLESSPKSVPSGTDRKIQSPGVFITLALFAIGFVFLLQTVSLTQAVLYLIAGVLGVGLYHARYGFTTSYRNFIVAGRGAGLRAQMVMFLIANLLFLPIILHGTFFGHSVSGYVFPVGISVLAGSFMFGIGMQLGDACASGTLYHTGGGDARGVLTLVGFVVGSVLGTVNFTWWMSTPHFQPVSFVKSFGAVGGLLFNALLLAMVYFITAAVEKRRNGNVDSIRMKQPFSMRTIFRGPWSWVAGSVVLAVGNAAVLLLSGRPWGVTSAFAMWGARIAQAMGIHVTSWGYWQLRPHALSLQHGLFHDVTTVLDIGIILGSLLAAGLAGRFPRPYFRQFPVRMLAAVFVGGVLMGYGARIAFGCNIGAYFAGIASFSLHGWEWLVGGMLGSVVGVLIRPVAALSNQVKQ